jgi:hypothetical protein
LFLSTHGSKSSAGWNEFFNGTNGLRGGLEGKWLIWQKETAPDTPMGVAVGMVSLGDLGGPWLRTLYRAP